MCRSVSHELNNYFPSAFSNNLSYDVKKRSVFIFTGTGEEEEKERKRDRRKEGGRDSLACTPQTYS